MIQGYSDPLETLCQVVSTTKLSLSLVSGSFSLMFSTLKSVNVISSLQLTMTIFGIRNPSVSQVLFDIYLADSSHSNMQGNFLFIGRN